MELATKAITLLLSTYLLENDVVSLRKLDDKLRPILSKYGNTTDSYELARYVGGVSTIKTLTESVRDTSPNETKEKLMSMKHYEIICRELLERAFITPTDLAQKLRYTPQRASQKLNELAALGLTRREEVGRSAYYILTSRGRKLVLDLLGPVTSMRNAVTIIGQTLELLRDSPKSITKLARLLDAPENLLRFVLHPLTQAGLVTINQKSEYQISILPPQTWVSSLSERGVEAYMKGDYSSCFLLFRTASGIDPWFHISDVFKKLCADKDSSIKLMFREDFEGLADRARTPSPATTARNESISELPLMNEFLNPKLVDKWKPNFYSGAIDFLRQKLANKDVDEHAYLIHSFIGQLYLQKAHADQNPEEFKEAQRCYRESLRMKETASAYRGLAEALYGQAKVMEAEASLDKALSLRPDYQYAHFCKQIISEQTKRYGSRAKWKKTMLRSFSK